ncbi:MAG: NAD-dependent epimerase/dehydratase family protein [Bacillota bacterium]
MKKILITGKNSYVGKNLEKWLGNYPDRYSIEMISLRDELWKEKDFSRYDVVFHVAGIAHVSSDPKMEDMYYKVNRDLTIETAKKAKSEGVKQFIFMSSIIVYGDSSIGKRIIDKDTIPTPSNFYGDSKLQAEEGIKTLESDNFNVVIIRPPMIYGKGSKGNYPKLSNLAQKLPIFPNIDNQRSMIHIDNLCEFIRLVIDNKECGIFFPQNREYVNTSDMVKRIADIYGKKIKLTKFFNPLLISMSRRIGIINKVFGNLVYEKNLSEYIKDYQIVGFNESIMRTENKVTKYKKVDILLMSDNGLETVGGEQESTKIIINGVKEKFSLGVIQPGEIKKTIVGADFYQLTSQTRIKHLVKHPVSFLKYILIVRKIINSVNPSIIHTQAQVSFFIVALLRKLRLIPENIKLIHTERGLYTKYNNLFKRVFKFFIKELDVLVTTTEFNLKYWKAAVDNRRGLLDFRVIENTAGELFETYDNDISKRNEESLVIGFAGRYCDWKNWPLAVEISKKLNEILGEKLNVKMAVGCLDAKAELETKRMFEELYNLLGNRFKGEINIDIKSMEKFYHEIDVFVLTSNYNTESFGRTLVEAMSRKTIVLTTDAGGSVEVVGNNSNVCGSLQEFIERIMYFYKNSELMEIEKNNNLYRVKQVYSLKNNINKHYDLYEFSGDGNNHLAKNSRGIKDEGKNHENLTS